MVDNITDAARAGAWLGRRACPESDQLGHGGDPQSGDGDSSKQRGDQQSQAVGALERGMKIGTHMLRHSYARHLLSRRVPLSRWLGHSRIRTKVVSLELVPDPGG